MFTHSKKLIRMEPGLDWDWTGLGLDWDWTGHDHLASNAPTRNDERKTEDNKTAR
jgi:hypothetical protein